MCLHFFRRSRLERARLPPPNCAPVTGPSPPGPGRAIGYPALVTDTDTADQYTKAYQKKARLGKAPQTAGAPGPS